MGSIDTSTQASALKVASNVFGALEVVSSREDPDTGETVLYDVLSMGTRFGKDEIKASVSVSIEPTVITAVSRRRRATYPFVASLSVNPPDITVGTDDLVVATAAVYVQGASDQGMMNNYALYVSGTESTSRFDGSLQVNGGFLVEDMNVRGAILGAMENGGNLTLQPGIGADGHEEKISLRDETGSEVLKVSRSGALFSSEVAIDSALSVVGRLAVSGPTVLHGDIQVIGADCTLTGSLDVTGSSTLFALNVPSSTPGSPAAMAASPIRTVFTVPVIVDAALTVNSVAAEQLVVSDWLHVEGGSVQVDANVTITRPIRMDDDVTIGDFLRVSGGYVNISAPLALDRPAGTTALDVRSGDTLLRGGLTVLGSATIGGLIAPMSIHSAATDSVLLSVTESTTTIMQPLDVSGPATMQTISIDPADAQGGALLVSNSATQTSGNLVEIAGTVGQAAMFVSAGDVQLAADLSVGGDTTLQRVSFYNDITALRTTTLRDLSVDPGSSLGGAVTIANSEVQTSGDLFRIAGSTGQVRCPFCSR